MPPRIYVAKNALFGRNNCLLRSSNSSLNLGSENYDSYCKYSFKLSGISLVKKVSIG